MKLYTAEQVREGEKEAAKRANISLYTLMQRAGESVFQCLSQYYSKCCSVIVVTGGGNNGGDGFEVAQLALKHKLHVTVWHIGDPKRLKGDALIAYQQWIKLGGKVVFDSELLPLSNVIIDAVLGTGLQGEPRLSVRLAIQWMNKQTAPTISIDIPSGLIANTGSCYSDVVFAEHTISFIGLKQGLLTGQARNYVGQLHFDDLGVGALFKDIVDSSIEVLDPKKQVLPERLAASHKGEYGRGVLIGGDQGMGGAILLASEACLNIGCGLTSVLTHPDHIMPSLSRTPEIMVQDWFDLAKYQQRIDWGTVIAIGPGLGQSEFARQKFDELSALSLPKVLDADALNLLAKSPNYDRNRILTPHPGEAARLLNVSISEIEQNRYGAIRQLQNKYGGCVILKGAGTLVCFEDRILVCTAGNAAMATSGMGDILTGILVGLLAQTQDIFLSACLGVWLHSACADYIVMETGKNVLKASDLIDYFHVVLKSVSQSSNIQKL